VVATLIGAVLLVVVGPQPSLACHAGAAGRAASPGWPSRRLLRQGARAIDRRGSGAEAAIAQRVLLATGSDLDGPVQLDVWVDSEGPGEPAGPPRPTLWDGIVRNGSHYARTALRAQR
jgi:hypothetical protein